MRVGGQIWKADLSEALKTLIILPKSSHVTSLVIRHEHGRTHHGRKGITVSETYVVGYVFISGNTTMRQFVSKCVTFASHLCLRVDFKILLGTFKILHGVAPSYLKDLVSVLPVSRYQLRRNNNGILLERPQLRTKKTLGDRALSMAAPFLWNSLPLPIRQETSIDSFKRSVKTYLFKKAFS